jgi:gliding motility-associated-like protein
LANNSGDVSGYIVYLFNGASWDSIGATVGRNSLFFQHVNPAAANGPQLYSVSAYDSCGNVSSISSGHNTLFLTAKLDVCRAAIDLRWNPYINMVNGVGNYNVYVSDNGGPFTFLASVPSSNISYSHTPLIRDHTYCYYIQAQGTVASRTSSSTQACEVANLLTEPTFSYLKYATVADVRKVIVECLVDTVNNPDVSRYKLQRSLERTGPYTTVAIENYTGAPLIKFTDYSARTEELSYFYRVVTVDSCGNEVLISNIGRTILLAGKGEYNLTNKLRWNDYENWLGAVKNYAIFREVDGVWEPVAVNNTIPFGSPEYLDDVAGLYQTQGRFCYRVEAYEGAGNPYGYTDTSRSNEFCLIQEPHLFVPNAFTPEGKNPVLKPQHIFIDFDSYFFAIYNRWGQKVFETKDPNEGWDGTYKGSTAPEGNYVYLVRIYGINGQEIEKNGSVTLLR